MTPTQHYHVTPLLPSLAALSPNALGLFSNSVIKHDS